MALLGARNCGVVAQVTAAPSPSVSPSPSGSPTVPPALGQPGGPLYATPFATGSPVTPPPVPTPTPETSGSPGPVFLVRPSGAPSIAPHGQTAPSASPSASPSAEPTLRPGDVAVLADKVAFSTKPGVPGDATGNVHVFYRDQVLVGDRAHYDGIRTITVTGNPYIVNNTKNTILYADKITFDTVAQKAALTNGRGQSSQGVERGLVYYGAKDFATDQHGVAHGNFATLTTCERPRAGYHVTGKTIDVYPGDKIVISRAILWLGAAAVFLIPKLVIPLRTVSDERQKPQFFPEMGYNSYQGYFVKAHLGFGYTQYYYGYYTIEFYSKQGVTLGYNGSINKKNGRRQTNINVQRVQDRIQKQTKYNVSLNDVENFSQTLHANIAYGYQSAFGPYTQFPPSQNLNVSLSHMRPSESQTYTLAKTSTGTQSKSWNLGFADTRQFSSTLQNSFSANLSRSEATYGTFFSTSTGHVTDLVHWASKGVDYQLNFDKSYTNTPSDINKEPELIVRPNLFSPHFIFPVSPTLTIGEYNEPQTPETTTRADLALNMGPLIYKFLGNDFNAQLNVHQYAYGTGDLKASVLQTMSLTSQLGQHVNNIISYNESNYNGPGTVPFSTLDLQNGQNTKNATDTVRFFNGDIYNFSLGFSTAFNRMALPVNYTLTLRPTPAIYANLQGTYNPGPSNGFYQTNAQLAFPLGVGGYVQFQGNVDWKQKGRIENKTIYYSRIIGDCYEIQLTYNQDSKQVNAVLNLLAFPSRSVSFGLTDKGSIIPSSFNGQNSSY
ncbi:MAG: hypothetical protein ABR508_02070 [Candidatus Baltobacteraceae bacterium]